jgi:hypothetical protein
LLGTALAAVAAGSLLAFSLVAQHAGLGDLTVPGPVTARGPGDSLGAITLPGQPGNPAAPGPAEPSPAAPEPTLVAEGAPGPTPEVVAPTPAPEVGAPGDEGPSFDGLDDERRPASTARVGDGELERGWQREGHGRASAKHDAKKGVSHEDSVPPGHARRSGAPASDRERGNGPPSTPPGHAKQEARGDERGRAHGHDKHKERGKHKGRAKHH